ncbi:MAG: membrane complex biogenesis BtpA family protein [Candidatus Krumholzibacteriia bacterium]
MNNLFYEEAGAKKLLGRCVSSKTPIDRKRVAMWSREQFSHVITPGVVGMIHLPALPGSPAWAGSIEAVEEFALVDAHTLVGSGMNALMIENYHDVPFHPTSVPAETIAAMSRLIMSIRHAFPEVKIGVNVLRNDVAAALAIAVATRAHFVRVNVHVGATVTDQGPIIGEAWQTLRKRKELGADHGKDYIGIMADVRVKHARPMVERPLGEEAQDLRLRGLADAIIVTGTATGSGADPGDIALVREALPDCPLLVGSGVTEATVADFLPAADGCIIGSSLKEEKTGNAQAPVSPDRCQKFMRAFAAINNR